MAGLLDVLHRNFAQALRAREFLAAEEVLGRIEAEDPRSVRTIACRLELLVKAERQVEARALLASALAEHPGSARIEFFAGRIEYSAGHYAEASERFRESDRLHAHPHTRRWLAKALREEGRLEQAEVMFRSLATEDPSCLMELALVYERQSDRARALEAVERHLARYPKDQFAIDQRERWRSETVSPEALVADLDQLERYGEPVPEHLVAGYVGALLRTAQGARARALVDRLKSTFSARTTVDVAFTAHRLQAFDLSFELFVSALPSRRADPKFLGALERAARLTGRIEQVLDIYRAQAGETKQLYGRIKKLEAELKKQP
jgi:tetratricopeptide (TPR) repeat protein